MHNRKIYNIHYWADKGAAVRKHRRLWGWLPAIAAYAALRPARSTARRQYAAASARSAGPVRGK
jgi:hypothetical protein